MKRILIILFLFAGLAHGLDEDQLSGFVADDSNGEFLAGVNVEVRGMGIGASTNREGFFLINNVPAESFVLVVSMVGHETAEIPVPALESRKSFLEIYLKPEILETETIVVEAEISDQSEQITPSSIIISPSDIKRMPAVVETDVFRVLQLMPGIQAASEISSGLYIRGGSPDQNLILLDGITVYNPNHFFGFFSAFNPEAIKDVHLIKGGFPAEFGGRISSVLDITNKDGNRRERATSGGISIISARATAEGPIKNFGSYMFSGRRTYLEPFIKLARSANLADDLPDYFFYDLNGKINLDLSPWDRLSFSGYFGRDNLAIALDDNGVENSIDYGFGNTAASLKWTHVFSNNLFFNFIISRSAYQSKTKADFFGSEASFSNDIGDVTFKSDIEFSIGNDHHVKSGVSLTQYNFLYTSEFSLSGFPDSRITSNPFYLAGYMQDEWEPSTRWNFIYGLRYNFFSDGGYTRLEPRFASRYILTENIRLKAAVGWFNQFSQLVTNEIFSFSDQWFPADDSILPSEAWQYILGMETSPLEGYDLNTEIYYKKMNNLLEFKQEAFRDRAIVDKVGELFYTGEGDAYGLELFLQKKTGEITGWIGYTLAWTNRTFPEINDGRSFAPKYDRRHDISMTMNYQLSNSWKLGSTFVYGTGQAYTYATGRYAVSIPGVNQYYVRGGLKNNYRLEPYHRMDISLTHQFSWGDSDWDLIFNIYNLYNHRNVWFRQYDASDYTQAVLIEDVRLLPILPTVGLNFKF